MWGDAIVATFAWGLCCKCIFVICTHFSICVMLPVRLRVIPIWNKRWLSKIKTSFYSSAVFFHSVLAAHVFKYEQILYIHFSVFVQLVVVKQCLATCSLQVFDGMLLRWWLTSWPKSFFALSWLDFLHNVNFTGVIWPKIHCWRCDAHYVDTMRCSPFFYCFKRLPENATHVAIVSSLKVEKFAEFWIASLCVNLQVI